MPTVIPAGFRELTMVHTGPGASGEVDLVFGIEEVGTEQADLVGFMNLWQDFVVEGMLAAPITFVGGRALTGPRPGPPSLFRAADPLRPIQGDQGANMLPLNNALLVQVQTTLGGVRGRGRKYFPGVAENIVDNAGDIGPASLAQYQATIDAWLVEVDTAGFVIVLLHGTGISATPAPTPITSMIVVQKMATQRTRLRD